MMNKDETFLSCFLCCAGGYLSLLGLVQRPDVFKVKVFYQSFANFIPAGLQLILLSLQGKKFPSAC